MVLKVLHGLGLAACIALVVSCFLPWGHYADINQDFTGFYSYQNQYGKPGKFLTFLGTVVFVFMLIPKVWAKRANLFICALLLAYGITNYIRFGSCYNNYCPERLYGLYLMLAAVSGMMIAAVFPKGKV